MIKREMEELRKDEQVTTYVRSVSKRKKFIVEYEDGTKEEYVEGILVVPQKDGKGVLSLHLNTGGNIGWYGYSFGQIAIDMMDKGSEEKMESRMNDK